MRILQALVDGITDVDTLSDLALGKVKEKLPELKRALAGCVQEHQRMMLRHQINHIRAMDIEIQALDEEIKKNRIRLRTGRTTR